MGMKDRVHLDTNYLDSRTVDWEEEADDRAPTHTPVRLV